MNQTTMLLTYAGLDRRLAGIYGHAESLHALRSACLPKPCAPR